MQRLADGAASIVILVSGRADGEVIVAETPAALRRAVRSAPLDFVDAMRRVEAEFYDRD